MQELRHHEQEQIAELLNMPGYVRLLELLDASERSTLAEVEDEADPARLLRTMRFWQFLHKVSGWLKTTPATIESELARLRESGQIDPDYPLSRAHAWSMRYGRAAETPEEDDSSDPASI